MRLIKTNKSGQLIKKEIEFYGGEFSTFEKIKLGRIGSPKVNYDYGLEDLDILSRNIEGEVTYINFEILKNGLIIRANCNQRQIVLGLKLSETKSIDLIGKRLTIESDDMQILSKKIQNQEIMRIKKTDSTMIKLIIQSQQYNDVVKFFSMLPFQNIFNHSIEIETPK